MKTRSLLLASLLLNLVLGLAWLTSTARARKAEVNPGPARAGTTPAASVPAPPPAGAGERRAFHWSEVESADYPVYIANLRRIGCPESTLRDIILADVNQLFAPRYAALGAQAPELAWWGRLDARQPLRAELAEALRGLDREKRALLVRLLGEEAVAAMNLPETRPAALREDAALAYLPEAKRGAVQEILRRYEAVRAWQQAQWKGLPSDERDAREKALREARQAELAALLTPEELREFQLRDSPTATALREDYGRANLTEAEFRRLYDLRREFEQRNPEARRDDWKRLEQEFANALGPERYADVQRQNDSMWRALQDLAGPRGLTPDALQQALTIKQDYTDRLARAVGTMFADPRQDPQPLRDIAAEMDARLAAILGQDTVQHLDRAGVLPRLVIQDDGKRKSYSLSRGGFRE